MGMGIEIPVWVIQSPTGKRTFNRKLKVMQMTINEDCIFNTPDAANEQLKLMDFGYKVARKRHYRDVNTNRIW